MTYQQRVAKWLRKTFKGDARALGIEERCDRFMEEAIELVQSIGYDFRRIGAVANMVYGRQPGVTRQEVGGTIVTLAALCAMLDVDMNAAGQEELARIEKPKLRKTIPERNALKRKLLAHLDEGHRMLDFYDATIIALGTLNLSGYGPGTDVYDEVLNSSGKQVLLQRARLLHAEDLAITGLGELL